MITNHNEHLQDLKHEWLLNALDMEKPTADSEHKASYVCNVSRRLKVLCGKQSSTWESIAQFKRQESCQPHRLG